MSTDTNILVRRRTFAAKNYPEGSPERAKLNMDPLTSEYQPSYRYLAGRDAFRTKAEAEIRAAQIAKGQVQA